MLYAGSLRNMHVFVSHRREGGGWTEGGRGRRRLNRRQKGKAAAKRRAEGKAAAERRVNGEGGG